MININTTADILVFAFRYALHRRTYAPDLVCDEIINHWNELDRFTQDQIQSEILEGYRMGVQRQECFQNVLNLKVKNEINH